MVRRSNEPLPDPATAVIAQHGRHAELKLCELSERFSEVSAAFDVESAAQRVKTLWQCRGYNEIPEEISSIWNQVRDRLGEEAVGQFNRMLLCKLVATSGKRLSGADLPPSVMQQYAESFARILDKLENGPTAYGMALDDTFLKDLGICAQTMIPAGYYAMDVTDGINRRVLFTGGVRQFFCLFWLYVVRYRRKGPFLFVHYHQDHKAKFTPDGRIETFRIIADLLICRPEFKAVLGSSWFYDPVVGTISPHLAYIRALPEENGAYFFKGRPGIHAGALTSKARRRLYDEGKYVPRDYAMVWPRERLTAWAKATPQDFARSPLREAL